METHTIKKIVEIEITEICKRSGIDINRYLYLKSKLEELEVRKNLRIYYSISNTKTSGDVINAKIKWPYSIEGRRSKFFNIYVGKLSNFTGVDDPIVKEIGKRKIKDLINREIPFEI